MGNSIKILSEELQNQIAAGEVVERPASVVKELVENSLDAGADHLSIHIRGGGQTEITVQDNGHGLNPGEINLALTRHATSKISSIQDLLHLQQFGFRGEALPSIASVSCLELSSITKNRMEGSKVLVEFGRIKYSEPVSLREGTRITVRDLFINTPARLKFLKKSSTEGKKCLQAVQKIALANLQAGFEFVSNDRNILSLPKNQSIKERLKGLWPQSIIKDLNHVNYSEEDYKLKGLISSPEHVQPKSDRIIFFVNSRPVHDKLLLSALKQAYKGMLLSREYPLAILFLSLPGQDLDINVHPCKSEVRFKDESFIFRLMHSAVLSTLKQKVPTYSADSSVNQELDYIQELHQNYQNKKFNQQEVQTILQKHVEETKRITDKPKKKLPESNQSEKLTIPKAETSETSLQDQFTYLGQFQNSYLLINSHNQRLLLIDQHAAHERVLFEKYKSSGENWERQTLAIPLEIYLHTSEKEQLYKIAPLLRKQGFSFQVEQGPKIILHAIPILMELQTAKDFLSQVLSEKKDSLDDLWSTMACKNAVKAGDRLNVQEAANLITAWLNTSFKEYCPHGRPTVISLSTKELTKMFKR